MAENEEANKRKSDEEVETSQPALKRVRLESEDLKELSKEEVLERIKGLNEYIDHLEKKQNGEQTNKELVGLMETGEKLKQQQQESTRRENVLVMRLATKEQEMQDLLVRRTENKASFIVHCIATSEVMCITDCCNEQTQALHESTVITCLSQMKWYAGGKKYSAVVTDKLMSYHDT